MLRSSRRVLSPGHWRDTSKYGQSFPMGEKKAADKGDANGIYQTALLYTFGDGVEQSSEQAIHWLEKYLELEGDDPAPRDLLDPSFTGSVLTPASFREPRHSQYTSAYSLVVES